MASSYSSSSSIRSHLLSQDTYPIRTTERGRKSSFEQAEDSKETSDHMDLAGWNSDLDSSFLNGWNENTESTSRESSYPSTKEKKENDIASSLNRSSLRDDSNNWDGNLNQWTQLPSFNEDYEATPSEKSKSSEPDTKDFSGAAAKTGSISSGVPTVAVSETASMTSATKDRDASFTESSNRLSHHTRHNRSSNQGGPQLHPQAIQASATCPPHSSSNKMLPPNFEQTFPHPSQPTSSQTQNRFGLNLSQSLGNSSVVNVPSLGTTLQHHTNHNNSAPSSIHSQNLSSLQMNYMRARSSCNAVTDHQPQQVHKSVSSTGTKSRSRTPPQSNIIRPTSSSATSGSSSSSSSRPSRSGQPPPFYLFDAPIELRANFMQNQRKLGIPIQQDCNSYHYGESVNGFHPQNHLPQQSVSISSVGMGSGRDGETVKLIDARHGGLRNTGRAKNEREQKRAQKITELIDQLRVKMEQGGWKVEMKSKFHTLSSCAEYVKFMVKTMKEKEEVVKKLKTELTVKQDRMEEDKTVQESRSDPESVTSSLTSSTSSSRVDVKASMEKKRKANSEASGDLEKRCAAPHNMSSVSSNGDSSGEDRASSGPTAQSISIDKTVSSVSDVTDSNRGSSSNNSGSGSGSRSTEQMSRLSVDEGKEAQPSLSSISSDAAVASEKSSQDHHSGSRQHNHKDVIFSNKKRSGRMKSPVEVTSLERSFELNYEEVFDNSNVPQLIAGTSGKIVTWNKGFLKATGLRQSHLERMTIFSLVKLDKLSNFFEMVAEALRCNNEQATPDNSGNKGNSPKKYAAMTLPCIDFPAMKKLRKKGSSDETSAGDRLHVTITLMSDRDPRKTCFHCTFTNCPGTNGALGSITNDLLVSLFASTESSQKKSNSRHRRKHKRARIQEEIPSAEDASKDTQKHTEEVATKEELRKLEVDSIER